LASAGSDAISHLAQAAAAAEREFAESDGRAVLADDGWSARFSCTATCQRSFRLVFWLCLALRVASHRRNFALVSAYLSLHSRNFECLCCGQLWHTPAIDTAAVGTIAIVAVRAFVAEVAELSSACSGIALCGLLSVNTWWVHEYSSMLLHHMPWMVVVLHALQAILRSASKTPQRLYALPSH
jgi:hypothetical protein